MQRDTEMQLCWVSSLSLTDSVSSLAWGSLGRCFGHTQPKEGLGTDPGQSEGTNCLLAGWPLRST